MVVESDHDGCVVQIETSASKQQFKTNSELARRSTFVGPHCYIASHAGDSHTCINC